MYLLGLHICISQYAKYAEYAKLSSPFKNIFAFFAVTDKDFFHVTYMDIPLRNFVILTAHISYNNYINTEMQWRKERRTTDEIY